MLSAALVMSGTVGIALGAAFVLLAPVFASEFTPLTADSLIWRPVIVGSGLTAAGLVTDQALVGLLRTDLNLGRNVVAALGRFVLLVGVVLVGWQAGNSAMVGSWSVALAHSLGALALVTVRGRQLGSAFPPA